MPTVRARLALPAMAALGFAAICAAAEPSSPAGGAGPHQRDGFATWGAADYPLMERMQGRQGVSVVELAIDVSGEPYACSVVHSTGRKEMDKRACEISQQRMHFTPARDEQGRAIPSASRSWFVWRIDEDAKLQVPTDVDMLARVARMPPGLKDPVIAIRRVERADGTVESCAVETPSTSPALDRLACLATAGNAMERKPLKDATGAPIRGLRTYRIAFTDQPIGARSASH
jgi:TonB family protein